MHPYPIRTALLCISAIVAGAAAAQELKAASVSRADGQAAATAVSAKAPGKARAAVLDMELRGQIVEIGPMNQVMVVRVPNGDLVALTPGPRLKSFRNIRVGDDVVVKARMGVVASIDASGGSGIRERLDTHVTNGQAKGSEPFKAAAHQVQLVGTVEKWNPGQREVTIRGVSRRVTLQVPERIDVAQVREGAEVRATFTEAVAIGVAPAKP